MRRSWLCLGVACMLLWTAACEKEREANPEAGGETGRQEEQAAPPESSATDAGKEGEAEPPTHSESGSDRMPATDAVTIALEGEPRLKLPAATLVSPTTQTFHITFPQPMDRESVERIIRANSVRTQNSPPPAGKFAFDWQSDTELKVELRLSEDDHNEPLNRMYNIDVNGATTKQGADIRDQFSFLAVVSRPHQLWRLASDGKTAEPLTAFDVPYGIQMLDQNASYLLLTRHTHYCECDAPSIPLYSVYDTATKTIVDYPVPLFTHYEGEGAFVVDRRGFMYADTKASDVPAGKELVRVKIDGYVQGAQFSKDGRTIIAAVGRDARQIRDFDLVLIDLASGGERRYAGALKGRLESDMLSDGTLPVSFYDDGHRVYTRMYDDDHQEIRYSYDWAANRVGSWSAPEEASGWSGFAASADGEYRLYANAGLYRGEVKRDDAFNGGIRTGYPVHWLGESHTFAYKGYEETAGSSKPHIYAHDADSGKSRMLVADVPWSAELIGASPDGRWIYVRSMNALKPH